MTTRLPMLSLLFVLLALLSLTRCAAQRPPAVSTKPTAPDLLWWEAETPRATNFPPPAQNPFAPANATEAAVLSGGKWIGATGDRSETLFLEYDVMVPKNGTYQLFARKFWKHGPYRWRFDDQPWQQVGGDVALLDDAPMRQFTGANWTFAGNATLAAGRHTLRIELTEKTGAAAFDAFVLTTGSFTPRGKLKPGEKYNRAPEGWFPFEPDPDPFAPSPIDLRSLNEKAAGDGGFIGVRSEAFVHGKTGKPVRFWAVNAGNGIVDLPPASVNHLARMLAKYGVNMVRIHGPLWGSDIRQADPAHLRRLFTFINALKRQGIYTCLSIYFPLWMDLNNSPLFAGYSERSNHPFALLFFHPELQKYYRAWWRAVLTTPNPETGKPLRDDPALAVVELVNEDSYLFWTFTPYQNIPAPQMALLEAQFGAWLTTRYGSLDKAFAAWGGSPVRGDDAAAGRAGFMPLYEIFNRKDRRAQDTAAFLTESQKAFFDNTIAFLRNDLGYKATVYGSNWITANAQILGPLDKYTNTVADFMDRHGYFDAPHEGPRAGYSISAGDTYEDRSALLFQGKKPGDAPDFSLPIMDLRYNNLPSTITEVNWTPPNRFRADLPLVAAAYGVLQGTDGFFFFALGGPGWQDVHGKFDLQTPVMLGQFPATAFLYRQGLVAPGDTVVQIHRTIADLKALQGIPVSAPVNLDELRARDIPPGKTVAVDKVTTLDPLAFLVGKVSVTVDEKGGSDQTADLSRFIHRDTKTVRSQTGQLAWNWGDGLVTVNAPQAQGATGFLAKSGAITLKDVRVSSGMEYGTILLVALDNQPIASSQKLLLQVMSEDANFGWEAPAGADGRRAIRSIGAAPIVVRKFAGTISLTRPDAAQLRVTALDANGYRGKAAGTARALTLLPDTLYYLIEK